MWQAGPRYIRILRNAVYLFTGSTVRLSQSKTRLKNRVLSIQINRKSTNVKAMSVEKCNSKQMLPLIHISIIEGLHHRSIKTKSLLFGNKRSQMSHLRKAWHFMLGPAKKKRAAIADADDMRMTIENGDVIIFKPDGGKLLMNREEQVMFADLPDENYKAMDGVVCFKNCRLIDTPMSGQEAYILSRCPSMFAHQEGPKTVFRVYTLSGVNRLMKTNEEYWPSLKFLKSYFFIGAKTVNEVRLMVEESEASMDALMDDT